MSEGTKLTKWCKWLRKHLKNLKEMEVVIVAHFVYLFQGGNNKIICYEKSNNDIPMCLNEPMEHHLSNLSQMLI